MLETLEQVKSAEPVPPSRLVPGTPRDAETVCLKCLQKVPDRRYGSEGALADDLRRFAGGEPVLARPVGRHGADLAVVPAEPGLAAASGLAMAALVTVVTFIATAFALSEVRNVRRLDQEQVKLRDALKEAREKTTEAREKTTLAEDRWREGKRESASLALYQGLSLCQQGEPGRDLLWLVRSLENVAQARDRDLERALRLNLNEWSRGFHPCETALQHPDVVQAGVFSPDAKTVLTGCADGTVRMWDATTGSLRSPLFKHEKKVLAVAFSPDGKQILVGDDGGIVRLWNASTGAPIWSNQHGGPVDAVAFSPDGRKVLTGGGDNSARLWDTSTGNSSRALPHPRAGPCCGLQPGRQGGLHGL